MNIRLIRRIEAIERDLRAVAEWLDDNSMGNGVAMGKLNAAHGSLLFVLRDLRTEQ